jgi:hypothetical protein
MYFRGIDFDSASMVLRLDFGSVLCSDGLALFFSILLHFLYIWASQSSLFVGFLISWISLHTKTTKIDFTVLKWSFHPTNTSLLSYYRQYLATIQMYKKWSKMEKNNAKPSEHRTLPKSKSHYIPCLIAE